LVVVESSSEIDVAAGDARIADSLFRGKIGVVSLISVKNLADEFYVQDFLWKSG